MASHRDYDIPVYAAPARRFHWLMAALILVQVPLGLYMVYRGDEMPGVNDKGEAVKGVWNGINDGGLTGTLFSSHKLIGISLLVLVLMRLAYRLMNGAPQSDPTVPAALTGISHGVHWLLYLLLIAVPIGGYIATSYYGALDVFGIPFPAVTAKDEKFAEVMFGWHGFAAKLMLALAALHIAAALYHKLVRKDRLVERMLPKKNLNA